ncbi:hypothetical protein VUR80DRAFT_6477 [Thermomyces stellatus]
MCLRKHTDWSCGHHTIRLSQCHEPADRGCLSVFLGRRRCRADDVFRVGNKPCPSCRESVRTRERRSAERQARRQEMRASYDAHRSSTESSRPGGVRQAKVSPISGGIWEPVVPGSKRGVAAPEPAVVHGRVRPLADRVPPPSSSTRCSQISREAYSSPAAGGHWDPVVPRSGPLSSRVNGHRVKSPGKNIWEPVKPREGPWRAPEEWTSVPLA